MKNLVFISFFLLIVPFINSQNLITNPCVGGSNFIVGEKDYTFGGLCYEFLYSGELQDLFPLTGQGFLPLKEVMENNKDLNEIIKKRLEKEEKEEEERLKREAVGQI